MTQPVLRLASNGHEISASNKLQQALVAAEQLLVHFLGQPAALSRLEALFSGQRGLAPASWHQSAQAFLTAFQAGERSVDLDLRSAQELPTALGAFSATGTTGAPVIYLNQDWLDQLSAAAITRVILEESGHWIDNQINGSADSPGDEGEAFAAAVLGLQLSQAEAQRIQLEDDKLCITLDGIELEVELASVLFPNKAYFVSTSSSSTTTQLESNSVYTLSLIGDAADRYVFITDPTTDPIFSGNNTRGYFYVVDPLNRIKSSYFGEITRLYKKGSTVEGFQFYAYPPGYVAGSGDRTTLTNTTILVDLTSTGIQLNQSYGTSSDPVDEALNQLLAAAPADAVNDVASAGEKGGASNQTAGFDASGNVLNNDLGGITNYSINTSTDPDTLVITPSARAVIAASSILTGNSSSVPASTTSTTGPTNIRGFYGNLYIGADGSYRYVVDDNLAAVQALRTSGNTLLDTFSYTLLTSGSSDVATLSITIQGSNDTPVARNDYGQAKESLLTDASGAYQAGDPLGTKAIGNVLPNDTDVDAGDSKTVVGSITIAGSGIGTTAGSASVTTSAIGANVNNLTLNTPYDAYIRDASGNYLALLAFDGSIATLKRTSSGQSPTFTLSDATNASAGFIVYAHTTGSTYVEAFTISSVTAASGATINISAPAGSIATGMTVSGTGVPGGTTVSGISYDASGNLTSITLSTAVQINGTALSFGASTAIGSSITGQYGTLILNSNGGYTYTPFNNNPGLSQGEEVTEVFSYTMQDTAGAQSTANLFIKVLGSGSTDPNAVLQSNAADEQGGINNGAGGLDPSGNLLTGTSTPSGSNTLAAIRDASGSIVDASGSIVQGGITYNAKARGLYGDLYFTTNGTYIYVLSNNSPVVEQLQAGQQLSESFEYKISNGSGSDWSTLTITINGANDTPVARPDFATALGSLWATRVH